MAEAPEFSFSVIDDAIKADPYPTYEAMRATGRVVRNPLLLGQFMVPGYDDVTRLLNDPETFSNGGLAAGAAGVFPSVTMLTADPPDHERLRGVVARAFTPKSVTNLEPRMRNVARQLLAPLADGASFDVVTGIGEPLPVLMIAEMLGVGGSDVDDFVEWSHGLMGVLDPLAPPEKAERARGCAKQLFDFFGDEVARRRHAPTADDLIGRLVAANDDGTLSEAEMLSSCVLLLLGGNETTTKLITNAALALLRNPVERARVAADAALVSTAVEEALRYDTPVQGNARVVTRATQIAGFDIPEGSLIVGLLGAANRDPDRFENPDRFDAGRNPNPHLSFSRGIHFCLGANLARLEARAAIGELLRIAPDFALDEPGAEIQYGPTFFFHAPVELAITR